MWVTNYIKFVCVPRNHNVQHDADGPDANNLQNVLKMKI